MAEESRSEKTIRSVDSTPTSPSFRVERVASTPSDGTGWGLEIASIPPIWKRSKGEGVTVAVLDTGIDHHHPDLRDAILDAENFTDSAVGAEDVVGHGTHVAGIIAARRSSRGVVGVAPRSNLLVGKVLNDHDHGSYDAAVKGIHWAVEKGARIISMSMGDFKKREILHDAVKYAIEKGLCIICAAGNEGPHLNTVIYPAAFPETIAVGAIDRRRKICRYSSRGKRRSNGDASMEKQVHVVAPGDRIWSTFPPKSYAMVSGSSMAAAFVSGVAALMLASPPGHGKETSSNHQGRLIRRLEKTSIHLGGDELDPRYGFGLINPKQLLVNLSLE